MDHQEMSALLRNLALAAEAGQRGLFQHVLGQIIDLSADDGMHPAQQRILAEGLCREFDMDEALAHQVTSFVTNAPAGAEIGM